jgi:hypothetical protein
MFAGNDNHTATDSKPQSAWTEAWHLWSVFVPRRSITGRLVYGQVWKRHDGRHWTYKKFTEFMTERESLSPTRLKVGRKMPFPLMKLKPESGASRIKSADDAYSFVAHMRLSYQNKPHWQMATQALNNVCASNVSEIHAWRTFRAAVAAEGWLVE